MGRTKRPPPIVLNPRDQSLIAGFVTAMQLQAESGIHAARIQCELAADIPGADGQLKYWIHALATLRWAMSRIPDSQPWLRSSGIEEYAHGVRK